ncbi:hypothetical protein BDR03DRAFT_1013412 [Suillus americanus]|nr:hypothetical protein BDR03DRAFT_1013412 [Suillus americanus]
MDAVFEILWKSGDTTWLGYKQVEKLGALTEYLSLLRIEDVLDLIDGSGEPLKDDPQVFLGHLTCNGLTYKVPISHFLNYSLAFSQSTTTNLTPKQPIMTPSLLNRISTCRFTLPNALGEDGEMLITPNILHAYLEYDTHLRAGTAALCHTPCRYGDFALTFNLMQTDAGCTTQMVQGGPDEPRISGLAPSLVDLIGEESAMPTPSTPTCIPEGGRYLNQQWAELLEEALWMNLETSKKKCEWHNRSIAERKASKMAKNDPSICGTRHNMQRRDRGKGSSAGSRTASPSSNVPMRMEVNNEDMSRAKKAGTSKTGQKEGDPALKRIPKKK